MGKGTEGLQERREEFEVENEGITILTQERWLANPRTIGERRHPNSKRNHIEFSNRCAKKTKAARAARQSWKIGQAGQASTLTATDVASGTNRVVLGPRPEGTAAEGGGSEVEMADVEEVEAMAEVEDVTMTEPANTTATESGSETPVGALATSDSSVPAQLRWVVRVDHCSAEDGNLM